MESYIINEESTRDSIFIKIDNFLSERDLSELKDELSKVEDWKVTTKFDNKTIQRLQKWYQIDNQSFGKKWYKNYDQWKSNYYTDFLISFQNKIKTRTEQFLDIHPDIVKSNINSLLINYYQDGSNGITAHRDDEGSFGMEPTIFLFSVGGPRTFCIERTKLDTLKRDKTKCELNKEFILNDNSMFIMAGGSQRNFCHFLKKEPDNKNSRYSMTFREFIY